MVVFGSCPSKEQSDAAGRQLGEYTLGMETLYPLPRCLVGRGIHGSSAKVVLRVGMEGTGARILLPPAEYRYEDMVRQPLIDTVAEQMVAGIVEAHRVRRGAVGVGPGEPGLVPGRGASGLPAVARSCFRPLDGQPAHVLMKGIPMPVDAPAYVFHPDSTEVTVVLQSTVERIPLERPGAVGKRPGKVSLPSGCLPFDALWRPDAPGFASGGEAGGDVYLVPAGSENARLVLRSRPEAGVFYRSPAPRPPPAAQ